MHRHGPLPSSNTDMATTFDPLWSVVGVVSCCTRQEVGYKGKFTQPLMGCHELNMARKSRGLRCSTCGRPMGLSSSE
jgi:hypothetical protein